jgi:hypothetical protein
MKVVQMIDPQRNTNSSLQDSTSAVIATSPHKSDQLYSAQKNQNEQDFCFHVYEIISNVFNFICECLGEIFSVFFPEIAEARVRLEASKAELGQVKKELELTLEASKEQQDEIAKQIEAQNHVT